MSLSSLTKGQPKRSQGLYRCLGGKPGVTQQHDAREPGFSAECNLPPVVFPVESQSGEEDVLVTDG